MQQPAYEAKPVAYSGSTIVLYSTAQHSTAQHSTAQRSAAQPSATQHSTAQHSRHLSVQAPAFALQLQPAWSPQDPLLRRSADSCCCLFQRRHMASASACPALSHSQTPDTSESCKDKTDISQRGWAAMGCHMTWKLEFHRAMVWCMCVTLVCCSGPQVVLNACSFQHGDVSWRHQVHRSARHASCCTAWQNVSECESIAIVAGSWQ